ncbi:MAG: hypothetical protein DVB30_01655 [Verrucomicrobia bacterium]|nr:MAG: hypothetical protein DVB30_01655 [Verrucomicrobiota bacterium]
MQENLSSTDGTSQHRPSELSSERGHTPEKTSVTVEVDDAPVLASSTQQGTLSSDVPRRRRRSSSERHKNRNRTKTSGNARESRKKQRARTRFILLTILFIIAVTASLVIGFLIGQQSKKRETTAKISNLLEVIPTSESLSQLDGGFEALRRGDARKAMLDFQSAQRLQPLFGLDYLVAEAAFLSDEPSLAHDAAERAVTKNEMSAEALVLMDLINFNKEKASSDGAPRFATPFASLENTLRKYAASHPADSKIYYLWGDLLGSQGSYKSAMDMYHRGAIRADSLADYSVLTSKEALARLQSEPDKSLHSLSEITAMSGEQSVEAAFGAMQQKNFSDALQFLDRAKDSFTPEVFREILKDHSFDPYRSNPQLKDFFKKESEVKAPLR